MSALARPEMGQGTLVKVTTAAERQAALEALPRTLQFAGEMSRGASSAFYTRLAAETVFGLWSEAAFGWMWGWHLDR